MSLLNVSELAMNFGGLKAIQSLNFTLSHGEIIGLIGPNGAGKTTCFNILTGVYKASSGTIKFCGENISNLAPHQVCRLGISRTFQNIRLFKEMTVLENVLVSLHPQKNYSLLEAFFRGGRFKKQESLLKQEALICLKELGLEERANELAKNLPYGEQRKVEIARALAARPQLLLLDEPAAGLNPSETSELAQFICEIQSRHKISILLIEHDMSLVMKICKRIYVLDYGKLIAEGLPSQIQNNPKVIEAYLGGSLEVAHSG